VTLLSSANGRPPGAGTARPERCSKQPPVDLEGAERAARGLLVAPWADLELPGLRDTPRRMAAAYRELLAPEPSASRASPTRRDTTSSSWCATSRSSRVHASPPAVSRGCSRRVSAGRTDRRPVEARPRRRVLCSQPPAPGATDNPDCRVPSSATRTQRSWVVLEAEHLCMSLRGAEVSGARTVTSALDGIVRDDPRSREEFLSLTLRRGG
jgi:GTP cyclohydrolase I